MSEIAVLWIVLGFGQSGLNQSRDDVADIRAVLTQQVASWNSGNVEEYMKGYWKSDSTLFASGGSLIRGWDSVLARYQRTYNSREKMGRLEFNDLEIRKIASQAAIAYGVWRLHRASGDIWGRFTLVVEVKDGFWRITQDHTSAAS